MPQINEIIEIIESLAPPALAESWDNSGLQVGSTDGFSQNIMSSVDVTLPIAKKAFAKDCRFILSHHPLFFNEIKKIDFNEKTGELIKYLIEKDITVYSAHTNLDKSKDGFNKVFKDWLDLRDEKPVEAQTLSKLVTFVPHEHTSNILAAMANVGAGIIGNYNKTSFRQSGIGTFEATELTKPAVGRIGFNEVKEDRLEIQFDPSITNKVIAALKGSHPYEEVAFDIYNLANKSDIGIGIVGDLSVKMPFGKLIEKVKKDMALEKAIYIGDLTEDVKKVAIIPGSGFGYHVDADVLITGDIKHHGFRDSKIKLIDPGHFEMESFAMEAFCGKLATIIKSKFPKTDVCCEKGEPARKFY
jgi:dinuclear metal center YbgI/SA1388 family protein